MTHQALVTPTVGSIEFEFAFRSLDATWVAAPWALQTADQADQADAQVRRQADTLQAQAQADAQADQDTDQADQAQALQTVDQAQAQADGRTWQKRQALQRLETRLQMRLQGIVQ